MFGSARLNSSLTAHHEIAIDPGVPSKGVVVPCAPRESDLAARCFNLSWKAYHLHVADLGHRLRLIRSSEFFHNFPLEFLQPFGIAYLGPGLTVFARFQPLCIGTLLQNMCHS